MTIVFILQPKGVQSRGIDTSDLVLTNHADSAYNCFKLSVVIDIDKVLDPAMWPSGMFIRKWRVKTTYTL